MNRIILATLISLAGAAWAAEPPQDVPAPVDPLVSALAALDQGNPAEAKKSVSKIESAAAQLFVQARIQLAEKKPEAALKTLAKQVVMYPEDGKWTAEADYLCAEIYLEQGMLRAAAVAARQIPVLHPDSDLIEKAEALRIRIKKLREESK